MFRKREAEGRTQYGRVRILLCGAILLAGSVISDVQPVQSREAAASPDRAPSPNHGAPSHGAPNHASPGNRATRQAASPTVVVPVRRAGPSPLAAIELAPADVARYREAFALQERGEWEAADAAIAGIRDDRLMGHLRQQRLMHPTAYKASYAELRDWLERHADHPEADKVFQLAQRRMAKGDPRPRRPVEASERIPLGRNGSEGLERPAERALDQGGEVTPRGRERRRGDAEARRAARELAKAVALRLDQGDLDGARRAVEQAAEASPQAAAPDAASPHAAAPDASSLDPLDLDSARAEVAAHLFHANRPREAYELARAAAERSGDVLPRGHWIAGLAAWTLGRTDRAARHFEALASIEEASPWDRSAGAFWAARAHGKLRRPAERARWLETAAEEPRTFYGLVAAGALGRRPQLEFRLPQLSQRHVRALAARPEARRAVALIQVGQRERAELELRRVDPEGDPALEQALVALSDEAGLAAFSLRLGSALRTATGDLYDAALYPLPPWRPQDGFRVDRALLFAVMRQESRFRPAARSGAGAAGLMQLMPETARFVGGHDILRPEGGEAADALAPEVNLALGQRYLLHLAEQREIGGDLVMMLAAYNAGPGNLQRWRRELGRIDDPLLFIERIPARETRGFVQLVLANYWIYRQRLGQPEASLESVAAGRWPAYIPNDPAASPRRPVPPQAAPTQVALEAEASDAKASDAQD
jgi:soluble lytic murein transglycosylase-like protein